MVQMLPVYCNLGRSSASVLAHTLERWLSSSRHLCLMGERGRVRRGGGSLTTDHEPVIVDDVHIQMPTSFIAIFSLIIL